MELVLTSSAVLIVLAAHQTRLALQRRTRTVGSVVALPIREDEGWRRIRAA